MYPGRQNICGSTWPVAGLVLNTNLTMTGLQVAGCEVLSQGGVQGDPWEPLHCHPGGHEFQPRGEVFLSDSHHLPQKGSLWHQQVCRWAVNHPLTEDLHLTLAEDTTVTIPFFFQVLRSSWHCPTSTRLTSTTWTRLKVCLRRRRNTRSSSTLSLWVSPYLVIVFRIKPLSVLISNY